MTGGIIMEESHAKNTTSRATDRRRRRSRVALAAAGAALAGGTMLMLSGLAPSVSAATPAARAAAAAPGSIAASDTVPSDTVPIDLRLVTLDQGCPSGQAITGAVLVLSSLGIDDGAPSSVSVMLSNGDTVAVPIDVQSSNGTAHYIFDLPAGTTITGGSALVPSGYTGNFNLSHYECSGVTSSSASDTASNSESNSASNSESNSASNSESNSESNSASNSESSSSAGSSGASSASSAGVNGVSASRAAATSAAVAGVQVQAPAGPIPAGVNAGQHAVSKTTPLLLGALLMLAGAGGLLMALRPWKRGAH